MTAPQDIDPAKLALPMFWPIAAANALFEAQMGLAARNLKFMAEEARIAASAPPRLATANRTRLNLRTLVLRDYSETKATGLPTLVDAPYAGRSSPTTPTGKA